ncbi:MAG: hypothetical protein WAM70_18405 [Pyrinomonadaceae bacterium]
MKKNFKRILGGLILGLSFAGICMVSSATAQAQQNDDWWNRNRRDNRVEQNRDQDRRNRRNERMNRNRGGRYNDGYPDLGGSFNLRQTALNAGFADGAKEGRKDRNNRERFDFRDENNFQKATRDYSSRLGDRGLYQRYYREAFENGYDDGYAGY